MTAYSLREQLGAVATRREPLTVWQQTQPQRDIALMTSRIPFYPHRCRRTSPLTRQSYGIARPASSTRLRSEVEAVRTAAKAAEQTRAEADEALPAADIARDAAKADRDRLTDELVEARAAAYRAEGQCAAAEAERDRLVVELSRPGILLRNPNVV